MPKAALLVALILALALGRGTAAPAGTPAAAAPRAAARLVRAAAWRDDGGNGCGSAVLTAEWCEHHGREKFEQPSGQPLSACDACPSTCSATTCTGGQGASEDDEDRDEDEDEDGDGDDEDDEDDGACPAGHQLELMPAGSCPARTHFHLESLDSCELAAEQLGVSGKRVKSFANRRRPRGCYLHKRRLWWNRAGRPRKSKARKSVCCVRARAPSPPGPPAPGPPAPPAPPAPGPPAPGPPAPGPPTPSPGITPIAPITGRFPAFSQQCEDDAGSRWEDEWAGSTRYYNEESHPSAAVLKPDGQCAGPVKAACDARGGVGAAKAAYLEGPVQCGGRGWFCRIVPDANWGYNYGDYNFNHCNATDYGDTGGHCHGSDDDSTYYWWVRDHFNRGYAGHLKCCCDWSATRQVAARCDYRARVPQGTNTECRDANEDHIDGIRGTGFSKGYEAGCPDLGGAVVEPPDDQCWEVKRFAINEPERARRFADRSAAAQARRRAGNA